MGDLKISQLPAATLPLTFTELLALVQGGANVQAPLSAMTRGLGPEWFGDGSDGTLVFDGVATVAGIAPVGNVYTLNRDLFPANMTVNAGVTVAPVGFLIFCAGTLNVAGAITFNGANGFAGAAGSSGGGGNLTQPTSADLAPGQQGSTGGAVGTGPGNPGMAVVSVSTLLGGAGGAGGQSGSGGSSVSTPPAIVQLHYPRTLAVPWQRRYGTSWVSPAGGQGGAGGASSSGDGTNPGGGAGGGGQGGGNIWIWAANLLNSGVISATGGTGGQGGGVGAGGAIGAGGGGGGGGGGFIRLVVNSAVWGNISVAGGAGGNPGNPWNGGFPGTAGLAGQPGLVLRYNGLLRAWQ